MTKYLLIISLILAVTSSYGQFNSAKIKGRLSMLKNGDSIEIKVSQYGDNLAIGGLVTRDTFVVRDGEFNGIVTIKSPWATFGIKPLHSIFRGININYIGKLPIEKGNDISVTDVTLNGELTFKYSGVGASRIEAKLLLDSIAFDLGRNQNRFSTAHKETWIPEFENCVRISEKQLRLLDSVKERISKNDYNYLYSYCIFQRTSNVMEFIVARLITDNATGNMIQSDPQIIAFKKYLSSKLLPSILSSATKVPESTFSFWTIHGKFVIDSVLSKVSDPGFNTEFQFLKNNYSPSLLELASVFALKVRRSPIFVNKITDEFVRFNKSEELKAVLKDIKSGGLEGSFAPIFSFQDTEGKLVSLSEMKGKIVVIDTWHQGCGPCRALAPYLKKVQELYYGKKDVVFISMCMMATKEEWLEGIRSELYSNPKVINLYVGAENYSAQTIPFFKSFFWEGDPCVVMIDKKGRWMKAPIRPGIDDGRDLISKIEEGVNSNM